MKTEIVEPYIDGVQESLDEVRKETDPKSIIASIDFVISNLRLLRRMADLEVKQQAYSEGRDL